MISSNSINYSNYNMKIFHQAVVVLCILCIVRAQPNLKEALDCIKEYTQSFQNKMNSQLYQIFKKSFPNTMETTIQHFDLTPNNESTYIITGDIQAMWLRDSTNQFLPYLRMPKDCPQVRSLAKGLINTQSQLIMIDPYTNAFKKYEEDLGRRHFYLNDKTEVLIFGIPVDLCRQKQYATPSIWERKFQIDSLASFLRLSYEYYEKYQSVDFIGLRFFKALNRVMFSISQQIRDDYYEERVQKKRFYTFVRDPNELKEGKIRPSSHTGLVKTGFRPSDDPNQLPYNIPGNAMLSTYLRLVGEEVLSKIPKNSIFKSMSQRLSKNMIDRAQKIRIAIYHYGIVRVEESNVFAYEIDGKGKYEVYEDPNLPSLISLPYLQFVSTEDEIYKNTRKYLLSRKNKYYYQNGDIKGIGSSHTPLGNIWPLGLITQILTSTQDEEIKNCLRTLSLTAKNNLIHESFDSHLLAQKITREWFAWANSFFGEMIATIADKKPHLLK